MSYWIRLETYVDWNRGIFYGGVLGKGRCRKKRGGDEEPKREYECNPHNSLI